MLAAKFDRKVSACLSYCKFPKQPLLFLNSQKAKTVTIWLTYWTSLLISQAAMRETWLNENQRLVSQDNFGNDIAAVEAATKKHEAIETDIMVC